MGRIKKAPKTGVFEPEVEENIYSNIKHLFSKVLKLKPTGLTLQDVEDVFIPPEHRETAFNAVAHLGLAPSYRFKVANHPSGEFEVDFSGAKFFYPPGRRANTECEGWEKIQAWCSWRLALGAEWGLVKAVFKSLHHRCARVDHVRYYWPPIAALVTRDATLQARLREYKPWPGALPLPPEFRLACRQTMDTLTRAMLLPYEVKGLDEPVSMVGFGLKSIPKLWTFPTFNADDNSFWMERM